MKAGTEVVLLSIDKYDEMNGLNKGDKLIVSDSKSHNPNLIRAILHKLEEQTHPLRKDQVVRLDKPRKSIKAMIKHGIAFNVMTNGHNDEIIEILKSIGSREWSSSSLKHDSDYIYLGNNSEYMEGFKEETKKYPLVNYIPKNKQSTTTPAEPLCKIKGCDSWIDATG